MNKLPFIISNIIAVFVPSSHARHVMRGRINMFLLKPRIARFIRHTYGEKMTSIVFVRQHTPNRVVFLVNDKYFIKVFKNVSTHQLQDWAYLVNFVRKKVSVFVPTVVCAKHAPIYACERAPGKPVSEFDKAVVLKNEQKIRKQVTNIISEIQSIDVNAIPNNARFENALQPKTHEMPYGHGERILAHFDLNMSNFLFDDKLNIISLIDWDALSIANNPNTDLRIFNKYMHRFATEK